MSNYTSGIYKDNNGDRMVVSSGAAINIEDGGALQLAGTSISASADEINRAADVSGRIVNVTATSLAVTEATHDGKTITLNSSTGQAVTLPAATGSGARFKVVLRTTISSGSTTIKVANTSDAMTGYCLHTADGGDTVVGFETTSGTDTITLNGSSTGGLAGEKVEIEDVAANLFHVQVLGAATGTEASPFSATV